MCRNLFTTSRTPGLNGDSLMMGVTPSDEVLVISKRQLYTVSVYHKDGSVLSVRDLELQIKRIQEDSSAHAESASKVNGVGVGTATVRPEWAKTRYATEISLEISLVYFNDNMDVVQTIVINGCSES